MTGPETISVDTACDWVKPIRVTKAEIPLMSEGTKRQILELNLAWKRVCGDGK